MTHPVPVAIDALVALLRTAALEGGPLAGVRIDDGPPAQKVFSEADAIGVGVDTEEFEAASSTAEFAAGSSDEPTDVQCVAQSRTGDSDPGAYSRIRTRAFELLALVQAELAARPDLGVDGVWDARVVRWRLRQGIDAETDQALAYLMFTVRISAHRTQ